DVAEALHELAHEARIARGQVEARDVRGRVPGEERRRGDHEEVDLEAVPFDFAQARDAAVDAHARDVVGEPIAQLEAQRAGDSFLDRQAVGRIMTVPYAGRDAVVRRNLLAP